ncbi:hypothetical protein ROS217_05454 [Roseovarius sp. 217]|nr:hypothetical protein ROS217_05454 [Roseovarius sp. 217]
MAFSKFKQYQIRIGVRIFADMVNAIAKV